VTICLEMKVERMGKCRTKSLNQNFFSLIMLTA
jgi:hypothetical protein